jgi:hypothetical protein
MQYFPHEAKTVEIGPCMVAQLYWNLAMPQFNALKAKIGQQGKPGMTGHPAIRICFDSNLDTTQ